MNETELNTARLNMAVLNVISLNAPGSMSGESEDIYILKNAVLLDSAGNVLLAEDGTPIVYN